MIEKYFVSHYQNHNQIPASYANYSLSVVLVILILIIILTMRRSHRLTNEDFSIESTETLKGIAIILLILGHLAIKCIEDVQSYEYAGKWAVIIFLLLSGIGLTKTYVLDNYDAKMTFIKRRLKRLLFPVWITLISFYLLDFFIFDRGYSATKILLSFLGIISTGPPNGPAWYITYLIYLYALFFIISPFNIKPYYKFVIFFAILVITTYLISHVTILESYFGIWRYYTIVFPLSILIGAYRNFINHFLARCYRLSPIIFITVLMLVIFNIGSVHEKIALNIMPQYLSETVHILRLMYLITGVVMLICLLDIIRVKSVFLSFLGKYSFEVYLLHLPFMEYYDFFLFRRPLVLYLLVYSICILILSYGLRRSVILLNSKLLKSY